MSLPHGTNLSITISCCEGLPLLSFTDDRICRRDAEEEVRIAKGFLRQKYKDAANSFRLSAADRKSVEIAEERLRKAEAVLRNIADFDNDVVPNPFAVLRIEGDDEDMRPILETEVRRGTRNPLWREYLPNFPLERFLTGKRSMDNGDCGPQNLVFYIYHDDVPHRSERTGKRDNSQRSICIGKAVWNLSDIRRKVGCPVFEKEIPVLNINTNRKISGAVLTIKAELWAPHGY